ncbi:WbqC family protein [Hymenobacter weizhouensis]|uniref:WbqC family protein n=1 Tax=Hymenobacter sp. YIM 151500-1 TaxID=2987689 RepID=UPI002227AAE2|nr:WbqC family protein [Hymenobacter sp. YIM 151500-1]UYZ65207.1 WbqC family protein [Hymenobacter sp. YIM 151500-1]
MQPYLFPYLGYFQLLHAADKFVLLDDVQFITRGWINRNRILVAGREHLFTVPLEQASQNKLIHQVQLQPGDHARRKLIRTIEQAYRKAPYFAACFPLLEQILLRPSSLNVTDIVQESLLAVAQYLGWKPQLSRSSALPKAPGLVGADRIAAICTHLRADEYLNMEGGGHLYSAAHLARHEVQLRLLRPWLPPYPQAAPVFVPGLSIIDVLMHNSPAWIRQTLMQAQVL